MARGTHLPSTGSELKRCSGCKADKPLEDFYPDKHASSGYAHRCKECTKRRVRRYREENRETVAAGRRRSNEIFIQRRPLYRVWSGMKTRCLNPKYVGYPNYGGRGITICSSWLVGGLVAFETWAYANGYRSGLQLDRVDNDGPYSPDNCRWVTAKTNCNNRRTNRVVHFQGRTQTIAEWAREFGVKRQTLRNRVVKYATAEEAFAPYVATVCD